MIKLLGRYLVAILMIPIGVACGIAGQDAIVVRCAGAKTRKRDDVVDDEIAVKR